MGRKLGGVNRKGRNVVEGINGRSQEFLTRNFGDQRRFDGVG